MVREGAPVSEVRKIAAILVADVVGYSRLAGADEDRTLSRLRALRSDLIDPAVADHHGRIVKRTGDGLIAEFRSVVEAVRCAIAMQNGLIERNVGVAADRRIDFRIGIHLGAFRRLDRRSSEDRNQPGACWLRIHSSGSPALRSPSFDRRIELSEAQFSK
jgi:class 3 adenylate cyclase